jgi:dihydropteroate synthase
MWYKNSEGNDTKRIESQGRLLDLSQPLVMGVINCNQDSFFAGSRVLEADTTRRKLDQLVAEGANIIDIGGRSSRPGSQDISVAEEIDRVGGAIAYMSSQYPDTWTSIDTTQSAVASFAVDAGVSIVNDISAGEMDPEMLAVVAELKVPYICMHMQGTPDTMQINPVYTDVVKEVKTYLQKRIEACLEAGIKDIIVDPGFGFGKTVTHNYALLGGLTALQDLSVPILAGFSRKSMIYKLLGITADEALNGTTALNMVALLKGVSILRVHDVKEAVEVVKLFKAIQ